jgi:two-component system KDP operon response regulator KdpE
MMKNILVVDDDPVMVKLISKVLTKKGYKVLESNNGQDALRILYHNKPDLVLLDVVMPEMDGWQTCSRIRDISPTLPIIMLTGQRKTEEDVVRGLDYGADDYLIKPVGNKELVARVQAMLRRAEQPSSVEEKGKEAVFSDGYLTVDIVQRMVTVKGTRVKLTPIEFRLLALLLQNTGRILTHQQLLEKVWGWEYVDDLDYVRIYVLHLRKKMEPNPSLPKYIITEPGVGYYFQKTA